MQSHERRTQKTVFYEYYVRITFYGTHPMEVLRFLWSFVDHRLEITEIEAHIMLPLLLKDNAQS